MVELLTGVAARARIAGLALLELVPERDDANGLSAFTAARIVAVAMGLMQRKPREFSEQGPEFPR